MGQWLDRIYCYKETIRACFHAHAVARKSFDRYVFLALFISLSLFFFGIRAPRKCEHSSQILPAKLIWFDCGCGFRSANHTAGWQMGAMMTEKGVAGKRERKEKRKKTTRSEVISQKKRHTNEEAIARCRVEVIALFTRGWRRVGSRYCLLFVGCCRHDTDWGYRAPDR